jgi:hypothetical protein
MAEQTNTTTDEVSDTPPPLIPSGNSNALLPGVRLRPRKVVTVAPGVTPPSTSEYTTEGYTGQNLVDSKGVLVRGQYSEDEAFSEIARFGTPAERSAVLNRLAALGLYGNSKPSSTGTMSRDISAVKNAMLYANAEGVTLDVALNLMAADPNIKAKVAAGARVRTTAKQDLRQVFKQAAGSVLGRQLSDAEVEKFVRSYNAMEVSEAMGGAAVPTAQTAALEAVEASNPEEAGAMKMLGYADVIDQLMKGLG